MNFSPYSPSPDDDRTRSPYKKPGPSSYQAGNPDSYAEQGLASSSTGNQTIRVNKYETSLPIRVDIEAALAYVLGPVTGLLLLILERQNDYVRFHAWQSALGFTSLMFAQFILLFISSFLSWVLFFFNVFLMLYMTYRAYLDGVSLERYELPYVGIIASDYVDTE
ncbi:hypothetical protein EDC96DRAFT_47788 [Choanephora cucurbitarum]|nr:hypothetical protein EDC96DRAFT_47788 [Choanephora cucurbitarum]